MPPRAPGKEIYKKLKKFFAGCRRHLAPGKGPWLKRPAQAKKPLPGARSWGTRQRNLKKIKKILCRVPNGVAPGKGWRQLAATFAGGHILPSGRHPAKTNFCRRLEFAECRHPAKDALPEAFICRVPPGLAPGKEFLCRVPDKKHPANFFAPGKSAVSCCDFFVRLPLTTG